MPPKENITENVITVNVMIKKLARNGSRAVASWCKASTSPINAQSTRGGVQRFMQDFYATLDLLTSVRTGRLSRSVRPIPTDAILRLWRAAKVEVLVRRLDAAVQIGGQKSACWSVGRIEPDKTLGRFERNVCKIGDVGH